MSMQAEHWNGPGGERWAESQEDIDRSLAAITALWLPWVAARPADRVLDVGCGCGTTTILMQERAAAASGVDISEPMLAVARRRAPALDFALADAQRHAFTAAYDLIVSRFGVMFFDDPTAAFANLRTALAPGGRLAFACWRPLVENPWAHVPLTAAAGLAPAPSCASILRGPVPPADPHAPGPFAFADRDRTEAILTAAGWRDVVIEPRDTTMVLGETLDAAVTSALTFGPLSRVAAELDEPAREIIRGRLRATIAPTMPAAIWLVAAR